MKFDRIYGAALAIALGACGGDDDSGGVDAAGEAADAAVVATSECSGTVPARAVVAMVNGDTDFVQVLSFVDAALTTDGPTFPVTNPRGVAMRSDGAEALVVWGGFGDPVGVTVLSIEEGGAGGEVVDTVDLGAGQTPFGIAYASDDRAVIVTAGPDMGTIVAVDRGVDGFAPGEVTVIPDNWPLEVTARPGNDEVVMVRADLGEDDASDIARLARTGDAWEVAGDVGQIAPPVTDVAVAATGDRIYGSSSNPDDPVGVGNLQAPGVLHVLSVDDGGVAASSTTALPGLSSFTAIAPSGDFLVLPTAIYEVDGETGTPIIRQYRLVTVPLDAAGAPGTAVDLAGPFDALLTQDLEIAPSGHALHALQLYGGTVPPDEESPLLVWAQPSTGEWQECQRVHLGGQTELAIAP